MELAKTIEQISAGLEDFKREQRQKLDLMETRMSRPGQQTSQGAEQIKTLRTASGSSVPILSTKQRLVDLDSTRGESDFTLARFTRDAIVGAQKAASGPALVPTSLSAIVLDDVRRKTAVVQAGARTIIIDGPTILARIASDPTVYQHTESAADISESDVTLNALTINPKALVATVPLSEELVADSPNLDGVLQTSLSAAFALKMDSLCLATLLADAAIPKSATGQDPAVWAKVLEAVGVALGLNQPLPTGIIGSPADLIARASQLASTAGTWLGKPPILSGMAEYETTGMTAGTALFGDWSRAFAIALRQDWLSAGTSPAATRTC